jgi:hypothetical protein
VTHSRTKNPPFSVARFSVPQRVGTTPRQQLIWLIDFVQREDLPHLRGELLRQVREEVRFFYAQRGGRGGEIGGFGALDFDRLAILSRHDLGALKSGQTPAIRGDGLTFTPRRNAKGQIDGEDTAGRFEPSWRWISYRLLFELDRLVRKCARPGCDRFFVMSKAQLFCSKLHSARTRTERHRRGLTERQRRRRSIANYAHHLERAGKADAARHYRKRHEKELGRWQKPNR